MVKNNINKIKKPIIEILKKHGVKKAGIFGSYARGEEKKNSDIDILVEIDCSLLGLISLEMELEKILRKKIDLLTYAGINPHLKEYILKDEVRII
ncbi:MAG: nucleotidyltransferase family protein [Nanoarchaeota archaeon]